MYPLCFCINSNCSMTVSLLEQGQNNTVQPLVHTTPLSLLLVRLARWLVCVAFHRKKFFFCLLSSLSTANVLCVASFRRYTLLLLRCRQLIQRYDFLTCMHPQSHTHSHIKNEIDFVFFKTLYMENKIEIGISQ